MSVQALQLSGAVSVPSRTESRVALGERELVTTLKALFVESGIRKVSHYRERLDGHKKNISTYIFTTAHLKGYTMLREPLRAVALADVLIDLSVDALRRPQPSATEGHFCKGWCFTQAEQDENPLIVARAIWVKG